MKTSRELPPLLLVASWVGYCKKLGSACSWLWIDLPSLRQLLPRPADCAVHRQSGVDEGSGGDLAATFWSVPFATPPPFSGAAIVPERAVI